MRISKVLVIPFLGLFIANFRAYSQTPDLIPSLEKLRADGFIAYSAAPDSSQAMIGMIGDSLVCGASADSRLSAFLKNKSQGQTPVKEEAWHHWQSPLRIFEIPSSEPVPFMRRLEFKGANVADCLECSFGAQLADLMHLPRENVLIAAEDGRKVSRTLEQFRRLNGTLSHLPQLILISWNANDLCHLDNRMQTPEQIYQRFSEEFYAQMKSALDESKAHSAKTRIVVVAALNIMNLMRNQNVLSKIIPTPKGSMTCGDVRRQRAGDMNALNNMCPNILALNIDTDHELMNLIEQQHLAMVRAQQDVTVRLKREYNERFEFQFIDSVRQIQFSQSDISDDCFHPSVHGQTKIAKAIFKSLSR